MISRRSGLALLVILFGAGACGQSGTRSASVVRPPADGIKANEEVLLAVPAFPGAHFLAYNETGSPKGGRGAMSYAYFSTAADRPGVISHFKSTLAGWSLVREESLKSRLSATFVHGNAWLSVSAENVSGDGHTGVPGYAVVVDALDASVLARAV